MKRTLPLFVLSLTGCFLVASLMSSCTTVHTPLTFPVAEEPPAEPPAAEPEVPIQVQYGTASWYGRAFHGRPTASGEVYDMYQSTAAHRTVPLGTYAVVTNLDNGQTTRVRINDRGPFFRGRIMDLSYAAARQIAMVRRGSARVKVEFFATETDEEPVISRPVITVLRPVVTKEEPGSLATGTTESGQQPYAVQVGAYHTSANAERAQKTLTVVHPNVWIAMASANAPALHRVRLGPFQNRAEAARIAHAVKARGYAAVVMHITQ